jgi:hypothetical protein
MTSAWVTGSVDLGPLDEQDRRLHLDSECLRDRLVGRNRLEPIIGFQERCVVLPFQQGKDSVDLQVVFDDLLSEVNRQIRFVQ